MSAFRDIHYERRVQFAETDMAGMVHFSVYLRYVEEAEHALWREAGLSIADPESAFGFPRISFNIEYHAPLHFEDVIDVHLRIVAVSRRTIRYDTVITRSGQKIATTTHTACCVRRHPAPIQAVEIPPDIVSRLEA